MTKKNRNRITLGTFLGHACLSSYALITLYFSFHESCAQREICSSITTPIVVMAFISLLGTLAVSWIVHQVLWEMLYVKPLQYKELIGTSETSEAIKITLSVDVGNSKIATKLQKKLSEGYLANVEILNDSVVTGTVDLQNAIVAASAYKRAIEKAVY